MCVAAWRHAPFLLKEYDALNSLSTARSRCLVLVLLTLAAGPVSAFNGHVVTEGPLRLTIGEVEAVTEYDKPAAVAVKAENIGKDALEIELEVGGLVDQWRVVGRRRQALRLGANGTGEVVFRIAASKGAYSVHYPVHVYARFDWQGERRTAHAVQIFVSQFAKGTQASSEPGTMKPVIVPANGAASLYGSRLHRVAWQYYDKPMVYMPQGWQGGLTPCRGSFGRQGGIVRGTSKPAISMHPPWVPGGGAIFADYLVWLPDTKPIKLTFANAIRTHTAKEPPSDGVTFRVWAGDDKVFERHTASMTWVAGEADLSNYAGREILLRLESHPGPKRDTTCDQSFWAEPMVLAGTQPKQLTEADREAMRERARRLVMRSEALADDEIVYRLGAGEDACVAAIVLGKQGIFDGSIALGQGSQCVVFDGLCAAVNGHPLGRRPTGLRHVSVSRPKHQGFSSFWHWLEISGERFVALVLVRPDRSGLRVKLELGEDPRDTLRGPKQTTFRLKPPAGLRITDVHLGPSDQEASRVYYGHGYCIEDPKAFRAGFGGHNLSTSHVGMDFEQGVSLLTACDNPPGYFEVNPSSRTYALHTSNNATFTFVPSLKGALDCAIKYRPLYDKKPAGGVKRKAGRFCFDIWGGRYAEIADTMQEMIDYGLTDSFLTVHVWQRWGYDYRLPDIWPPLPSLGTAEDMRRIGEVCKPHDIPWGLHDNYIDFYPDAAEYTYDHICFTESSYPIKAWINEGRDAQSYRWRPDAFEPFMKRNLKLIKEAVSPTHYFIDVFTSIGCFDYYDVNGEFHPSTETRKCWGETFAWIRDHLGGNAPTTSEAGHDQLTGYLDGADCQHLLLSTERKRFHIYLDCGGWERVPWYDAVLHDKFILHGVGYSGRYQGGRSRRDHGISSDDYISAEILEGHALMIDRGDFDRGAVRKYWLGQDFVRSIALDRIERVEFADNDIHRQIVSWRSGGKVYVNRGAEDWAVAGKVLPQNGYFAQNGEIASSIEKIGGIFVEQSKAKGRHYLNARTYNPERRLRITPSADRVEFLGDRRFKLCFTWEAEAPAPKDLTVFVHFVGAQSERRDGITFQGDHGPEVGTSRWLGRVSTQTIVEMSEDCGAGEYEVVVGLYDPKGGRRYLLRGDDDGGTRYRVGKIVAEGKGPDITNVRLVKHQPKPAATAPPRVNLAKKPVDFGPCVTDGAFRIQIMPRKLVLTPLPVEPSFSVTLRLDRIDGAVRKPKALFAIDRKGQRVREARFETPGSTISLRTQAGEFAYELVE